MSSMINNTNDILFVVELENLSRYLNISFGFIFLIIGIIGNSLNIIIFIYVGHYKENSCSFYMLIKSLVELNALIIGLGTRILTGGFQIDWTLINRSWCKIRRCWITGNNIISFSLLSIQSIDNYFCSSSSIILREKSNIKYAHRIVIGIIIFGIIHSIPFIFYQDLIVTTSGIKSCNTLNVIYNQYQIYFINLCLYVIIPVLIISIFGLLTYYNIHSINIQSKQTILSILVKQMIRMSLCNIIIVILFVTPYGIIQLYMLLISSIPRTNIRITQEQIVSTFSTIYFYGSFSVNS